jgi:hypothetical protein
VDHFGSEEAKLSDLLELRKSHLIDSTMKYNERIARIKQTKKANEYRKATLIKDVQRIEDKNTELASIRTSIKTIYARALSRSSSAAIHAQGQKKKSELS